MCFISARKSRTEVKNYENRSGKLMFSEHPVQYLHKQVCISDCIQPFRKREIRFSDP